MLHVLAEAGIPINKLSIDSFRNLLQQDRHNLGDPSDMNKLIPCLGSLERAQLEKEIVAETPFAVKWDETSRFNEVFARVVVFVDRSFLGLPY